MIKGKDYLLIFCQNKIFRWFVSRLQPSNFSNLSLNCDNSLSSSTVVFLETQTCDSASFCSLSKRMNRVLFLKKSIVPYRDRSCMKAPTWVKLYKYQQQSVTNVSKKKWWFVFSDWFIINTGIIKLLILKDQCVSCCSFWGWSWFELVFMLMFLLTGATDWW